MSYVSMGANSIFNLLKRGNILMVAEGVDVFEVDVPGNLAGKTIAESTVREKNGCSIIAVSSGNEINFNPEPSFVIEEKESIVLIGAVEAQRKFFDQFIDRN